MHSRVKWLYPGMRVKRWLLLIALGVIGIGVGMSLTVGVELFALLQQLFVRPLARSIGALPQQATLPLGLIMLAAGVVLIAIGYRETIRSLVTVILPEGSEKLPDIVFERRQLKRGPRMVVIGGGTGLSTLLRGLKNYTSNIAAIVTTADDGGSSGRIRNEFGIPAPGDIRNTLVALADTEPLMENLFQYRFEGGKGLDGHSFGNLFITALTEVTGDFEAAIRESSKVLAIRGRVLPSTVDSVVLEAEYEDGSAVQGESAIAAAGKRIRRVRLVPDNPRPLQEAIDAILNADGIVLGPGSLYTSILPNLLIPELADAVKRSEATKIFVCNVMTQPGETEGLSASQHIQSLIDHVGSGVVEYAVLNSEQVPPQTARRYEEEGAFPVVCDVDKVEAAGIIPVVEALIDGENLARHDSLRLAQVLMEIMSQTHPYVRWQLNTANLRQGGPTT